MRVNNYLSSPGSSSESSPGRCLSRPCCARAAPEVPRASPRPWGKWAPEPTAASLNARCLSDYIISKAEEADAETKRVRALRLTLLSRLLGCESVRELNRCMFWFVWLSAVTKKIFPCCLKVHILYFNLYFYFLEGFVFVLWKFNDSLNQLRTIHYYIENLMEKIHFKGANIHPATKKPTVYFSTESSESARHDSPTDPFESLDSIKTSSNALT